MNKYPRLRTHIRKGANGQVWVSYSYDNRPYGKDTPLGTDYAQALIGWDLIRNKKPLTVGRMVKPFRYWIPNPNPMLLKPAWTLGFWRPLAHLLAHPLSHFAYLGQLSIKV